MRLLGTGCREKKIAFFSAKVRPRPVCCHVDVLFRRKRSRRCVRVPERCLFSRKLRARATLRHQALVSVTHVC